MAQSIYFTEMINLLFPFLLLPLIIVFFLKHFQIPFPYYKSTAPLPPGPFLWTFLGNRPHVTLAKLARTYGPIMKLKVGTENVIVGSSKAAAIEILKTHDRALCGRCVPHVAPSKSADKNNMSVGFVMECNKQWRSTRTTCQSELFTNRSIESQASVREKKALEMVRFVSEMEGKAVKIIDIAFGTTLNMLGNILVSKDLVGFDREGVETKLIGLVREIVDVVNANNISDYFPILGGLDLQGLRRKSLMLSERMNSLWKEMIEERRSEKKSTRHDFLDAIIDSGCSDEQINIMLMELFCAGSDTSSATIEWTMAELTKNPQTMKKLKQELESQIQKVNDIKESTLNQLTYLQACVKETLRLHPPGPLLLPHRALETCHVMNCTIPKGSQVLVNFWAMGRDPDCWEDPLVYRPERFLNSSLDFKGNHFEYVPFGSGRRMCPGMPMATKQVSLVLACLVRFFDWSLPEGHDLMSLDTSAKYAFTLLKEEPLRLVPKSMEH